RYLVLDLDRTIHLGRDLGQDLGWELCAYEGYGSEHFETIEDRQQRGRFLLDWAHPQKTARYLTRSLRIWAYPGVYYGFWAKAAARIDWLRRRGFRRFVSDPVRAAQRLPQLTLLRHLETAPQEVLRRLAQQIWQRHRPDQVIEREDLAWVRSRWPQVEVVLSSASPRPTVEVAGQALGVDHIHYSTLDRINSGEAKIERLRELCARVGDPEVEIVGISDTSRGEDHCWAQHFTRVVDINSPTPFPAIVSSESPLLEVHSATLLTRHERARRADGDVAYLDARREKLALPQTKLELTREDLERRLGWVLRRVNELASAPTQMTGDIAYRLALLQEASTSFVRA
ncbi:MAG: haloacid dehalogenase-like hydrolase, partial [Deltaproteobacteria bacterium]|nr:haloacid dehalogenase-like hydrolase [Deltaproteobacteria bacterium]